MRYLGNGYRQREESKNRSLRHCSVRRQLQKPSKNTDQNASEMSRALTEVSWRPSECGLLLSKYSLPFPIRDRACFPVPPMSGLARISSAIGMLVGQMREAFSVPSDLTLFSELSNLPRQECTLGRPFCLCPRKKTWGTDLNSIHYLEQGHPTQSILDQLKCGQPMKPKNKRLKVGYWVLGWFVMLSLLKQQLTYVPHAKCLSTRRNWSSIKCYW